MTTNFLSFPPSSALQLTPYVLSEKDTEGLWKANILGWSDCEARGSTREEALSNLRQVLAARLEKAEIVPLELPLTNTENPWVKFAGMFKDDPLFDEFVEDMAAYRREIDAEVAAHEIASEEDQST